MTVEDTIIAELWPHTGEIEAVHFLGPDGNPTFYALGLGVDRFEKTFKNGERNYVPYIRVWHADVAIAELCQHRCIVVTFKAV